jgi:hypothetical protein
MTQDLGLAIQELKQAFAQDGAATAVLTPSVLGEKFHGLSLRQLVMLTDAPALAEFSELRSADGARVERFLIDGKDERQCERTAQQILLDENCALQTGDVREVCAAATNSTFHTLVRDHNDIVYRVMDKEASVDQELTALLQRRRQSLQGPRPVAAPRAGVVTDAFAFCGTVGEVLQGLAAARQRNGIAIQQIQKLVAATGERTLEAALAAATPEMLRDMFGHIVLASQQVEALLETLAQRTRLLLRLVDQAAAGEPPASVGPERAAVGGMRNAEPAMPASQPF